MSAQAETSNPPARKKIRWRLNRRKSKSAVWKTRWVVIRGGKPKK